MATGTDKVTTHGYQMMYGIFLVPYATAQFKLKMLEIGLGCDMGYGPGASVKLWKKTVPDADLWEAEFDRKCVESSESRGLLNGIKTLTGDQGNTTTLMEWIDKSGGNFDFLIDDGGHRNALILASFDKLWPIVNPGGLYVIEDLQVGRHSVYNTGGPVVADVIESWIDEMVFGRDGENIRAEFPPYPEHLEFIFCQREACVLGKKPHHLEFAHHDVGCGPTTAHIKEFQELSSAMIVQTDHSYQVMYGIFLMPFRYAPFTPKLLELGLGCKRNGDLWTSALPNADVWEEVDGNCPVESSTSTHVHTLRGDRSTWPSQGGWGQFDFIIDVGGRKNSETLATFSMLWPHLKSGGVYIFENLHLGRADASDLPAVAEVMEWWVDELLFCVRDLVDHNVPTYIKPIEKHPLPESLAFVFCQKPACVVGKS